MVNLGNVQFGLGADSSKLKESLKKLQVLSASLDVLAKKNKRSNDAMVRAWSSQESAILGALQKVLDFKSTVQGLSGPKRLIDATTTSFQKLTKSLTLKDLKPFKAKRALNIFNAEINKSKRDLFAWRKGLKSTEDSVDKFTISMRELSSAAVLAVGPLSGIGARFNAFAALTNNTTFAIAGLIASVTLAGVAFAKLSFAGVQNSRILSRITKRFQTVEGSAAAAAEEIDFIREVSDRTGTSFKTTADTFSEFALAAKNTALSSTQIKDVFSGMTTVIGKLELTADDTAGIFRAFSQMISKGTVQAEELRGQLGDRLFGAFQTAARAMGVTTKELDKLLKAGKVVSSDFLPKFIKQLTQDLGIDAKDKVISTTASLNKLATATFFATTEFGKSTHITQIFTSGLDDATKAINFFANNMQNIIAVLSSAGVAMVTIYLPAILSFITNMKLTTLIIGRTTALLGVLKVAFISFTTAVKAGELSVKAFSVALALIPGEKLFAILLKIGAAVVTAAATFLLFRKRAENVDTALEKLIGTSNAFIQTNKQLSESNKVEAKETFERLKREKNTTQTLIAENRKRAKAIADRLRAGTTGFSTRDLPVGFFKDVKELGKLDAQTKALRASLKLLNPVIAKFKELFSKPTLEEDLISAETLRKFKTFKKRVQEVIDKLTDLKEVQKLIASGGSKGEARLLREILSVKRELAGLNSKRLEEIVTILANSGITVNANVEDIASAIAKIRLGYSDVNAEVRKFLDGKDPFEGTNNQLETAATRASNLAAVLTEIKTKGIEAGNSLAKALEDKGVVTAFKAKLIELGSSEEEASIKAAALAKALASTRETADQIDFTKGLISQFDSLKLKIQETINKIGQLKEVQSAIGSGATPEAVKNLQALLQAQEDIANLTQGQQNELAKILADAGFAAGTLAENLANAVRQKEKLGNTISNFISTSTKKTPLEDAQFKTAQLNARTEAAKRTEGLLRTDGTRAAALASKRAANAAAGEALFRKLQKDKVAAGAARKAADEYVAALDRLAEQQDRVAKQKVLAQQFEAIWDNAASSIANSLGSIIDGTKSASDALKGIINQLKTSIIQTLIVAPLQGFLQGLLGGSSGGGLGGTIRGLFGGGKAKGGPVNPRQVFLVGEKGPELLFGASGTIVPPSQIPPSFLSSPLGGDSGGKRSINISLSQNIDARGADRAAVERARLESKRDLEEFKAQIPNLIDGRVNESIFKGRIA